MITIMRRLGIMAVGLALVVGMAGSACGNAQDAPPVVPPPGIRATVPAEFPDIEEARLRQLALEPDDLPPDFALAYEDATEEEGAITYVAHYFNQQISSDEELLEARGPASIDVMVVLFEDEGGSRRFFQEFASLSSEDLVRYTQTQSHWSAEDLGMEQGEVQAELAALRTFGDESVAWQVYETIRHAETDTELITVDLSVCMRRGRAVGMIDIGAIGAPPEKQAVEALAAKLESRLAVGLR